MDVFANVETESLTSKSTRRIKRAARSGRFSEIFPAGSAGRPALLVGRAEHLAKLNALVAELLVPNGRVRNIHGIALFGPRGVGKTVLLSALQNAVEDAADNVQAVSLTGGDLTSQDIAANSIAALIPPERGISMTGELSADLASGEVTGKAGLARAPARQDVQATGSVANALRILMNKTRHRTLICIDEAHVSDPPTLGALMSAVQSLNQGAGHVAFALAGTPDLLDAIRAAKATWFLDRAQEDRLVSVGNITDAECALAVAKPLKAAGIEFDRDALTEASAWCRGGPYFSQVLGQAAIASAHSSGEAKFADFAHEGPIWQRFRASAESRYQEVWTGIDSLGLAGCARQLGALWRWSAEGGERVYPEMVSAAVRSGLSNAPQHAAPPTSRDEAEAHFRHLGLLWNPSGLPDGPWEPGLPSFFDFVEAIFRSPNRAMYHSTLPSLQSDEPQFIPGAPPS